MGIILAQKRILSPHWGPEDPSGVQSIFYVYLAVSMSLCLSVSLYDRLRRFLDIICAARNCAQCVRPQATGSNLLNGKNVSVRPSGRLRAFCDFFICINLQCGVSASQCIYLFLIFD